MSRLPIHDFGLKRSLWVQQVHSSPTDRVAHENPFTTFARMLHSKGGYSGGRSEAQPWKKPLSKSLCETTHHQQGRYSKHLPRLGPQSENCEPAEKHGEM